jgi:hypothetical protein
LISIGVEIDQGEAALSKQRGFRPIVLMVAAADVFTARLRGELDRMAKKGCGHVLSPVLGMNPSSLKISQLMNGLLIHYVESRRLF